MPMIKRDAKDARIIWTKLGLNSVCFEAQGDRFGLYTHKGEGRIVGAVKLQHISGRVRCATSTKAACDSLWGCDHKSSESVPLNVIITDGANNIIFPLQKYVRKSRVVYSISFVLTNLQCFVNSPPIQFNFNLF